MNELRERIVRAAAASALVAALALVPAPAWAADSYAYDALGRLASVTYGNGVIIAYTYDANGNILSVVTSLAATGAEETAGAPLRFALGAATPNPGPGPRTIRFSTPASGIVSLRVFDISGRLVATLYDRPLPAGRYEARVAPGGWASGVYFYRLSLGEKSLTGRMVLLR